MGTLDEPRANAVSAFADAESTRESEAASGNSKGPFGTSPQALALETNIVTKIPALKVMVIAREIVFMKVLFLAQVNPAYTPKGAIRDQELAPPAKIFWLGLTQLSQKPGPGHLPIAHHRVGGDFHHLGSLFHAQTAEES